MPERDGSGMPEAAGWEVATRNDTKRPSSYAVPAGGTSRAKAAGMVAAEASRPAVIAASIAASRRSRMPALGAAVRG